MSNLYLFALVVFLQASIGHVQLRGKVQERKQNLVGLQGDDTSENQPQEINLGIPTTLHPPPLWSPISSPSPLHVVSQLCCSKWRTTRYITKAGRRKELLEIENWNEYKSYSHYALLPLPPWSTSTSKNMKTYCIDILRSKLKGQIRIYYLHRLYSKSNCCRLGVCLLLPRQPSNYSPHQRVWLY